MNKLSFEKRLSVLAHLCDGCGIRQTERLCHVNQNTVMKYLVEWGEAAQRMLDSELRNIRSDHVSLDEQWTFCRIKQGHIPDGQPDDQIGDQWLFIAQDLNSRLIISYLVGKRTEENTIEFVRDLHGRLVWPKDCLIQISSDGAIAYPEAIDTVMGRHKVKYGQIVKDTKCEADSPETWAERRKLFNANEFDEWSINTAYIERLNLTNRHFMRRLVRKCLCFSKKLENLKAAVALWVTYYNFIWQPRTFEYQTPAQVCCLTNRRWTTREVLKLFSN